VPASACAVSVSSERTQRDICLRPAQRRQSGGHPAKPTVEPSIRGHRPTRQAPHLRQRNEKACRQAFCRARSRYSKAPKASAAKAHPSTNRQGVRALTLAAKGAWNQAVSRVAIHFSSSHTSLAPAIFFPVPCQTFFTTDRARQIAGGKRWWRIGLQNFCDQTRLLFLEGFLPVARFIHNNAKGKMSVRESLLASSCSGAIIATCLRSSCAVSGSFIVAFAKLSVCRPASCFIR